MSRNGMDANQLGKAAHPPLEQASLSAMQVVACDEVLLAADKPAGLLVHGDGTGAPTLTDLVCAWLEGEGRPPRAQAVHRLDVATTGLVLFSLDKAFQPALDAQVAGGGMRKRYLAVAEGRLTGPEGPDAWHDLRMPLGRDRHDARRMRVSPGGKPAHTRVRTLACRRGHSLLLLELGTGRRHQIRVHLAQVGHPLLGDSLYGGTRCAEGLMLHAWEVSLRHPVTGEPLVLRAPVPERFRVLFPQVDELLAQE